MANIMTDVYTNLYVTVPPVQMKGIQVDGCVKRCVSVITGVGETTPTVLFCRPPKGARLSSLSKINFEDFGTSCTMSIGVGIDGSGNAAVPAKFKAATSIAAVGQFNLDLLAGIDYVFDGKTDLTGTVAGAVFGSGKKMVAEIFYALNN